MNSIQRRQFLRQLGLSAAALPWVAGLPSLQARAASKPKQRLVLMFSPNGTVPPQFWPDETGENFKLKRILAPLEPFKKRTLILKGISNKVRGDGDGHMRGMSCLLTAIELFPGNIQGGSDTPAGWASGPSIDQELKNFLQSQPATRTRFGSLELGVAVPNRADPWTRWTYAGPNQPVAPIDDPYQVFEMLYGQMKDRENLGSILDDVQADLKRVSTKLSKEDKALLDQHATYVRQLENELREAARQKLRQPAPVLEQGVSTENNDMPKVAAMQVDLLVNALVNDMARIATLQFTNSVGQARMRWLGIEEGHHSLSHDPDLNEGSQEKLTKINVWLCEQFATLARKLDAIPEPGGEGTMLDHTTLLWTNELGKGNSHSLDNIPFVLVGGGLGFKTGRSLKFDNVPHNRLWLAIAHAFGHELKTFGNVKLSEGGPLNLT
ncbi:MAG TPA: DUF1552 domain-containing protein [Methylomirabilota bacterium]|nr:DUF1552 domain-containing protein [Methylomirabilota bacterium]